VSVRSNDRPMRQVLRSPLLHTVVGSPGLEWDLYAIAYDGAREEVGARYVKQLGRGDGLASLSDTQAADLRNHTASPTSATPESWLTAKRRNKSCSSMLHRLVCSHFNP
jgi:hypothetical protein